MKRRSQFWLVLGVALSAWFLGFTVSPTPALSFTDTFTDLSDRPTTGFVTGLVGPIGSRFGAVPNVPSTTLGAGLTARGFGSRVDRNTGHAVNFPSNLFGQALARDSARYVASLWTAAPEPTTLLLFGTTLVGLGSLLRRRMRGAAKTSP